MNRTKTPTAGRHLVVAYCFVLLFVGSVAAQGVPPRAGVPVSGGFATIDYRACLALHPLMADYDFAAERFSRAGVKRGDPKAMETAYHAMAGKKKALEPRRQELERRRQALQLQFNNLDLDQLKNVIAQLKPASASAVPAPSPLSDARLVERRAELQRQIAALQREEANLLDEVWNDVLMTREETDKRLQQVINEVEGAIRETATAMGVGAVIDDTLAVASMPIDRIREVPESTPLFTTSLYRLILDAPFPEPGKPSMANHWASELQRNLGRQVTGYLGAMRHEVVEAAHGFRSPKLFVMGGVDITVPVCERLFQQYKVNPYLLQTLKTTLGSYRR